MLFFKENQDASSLFALPDTDLVKERMFPHFSSEDNAVFTACASGKRPLGDPHHRGNAGFGLGIY